MQGQFPRERAINHSPEGTSNLSPHFSRGPTDSAVAEFKIAPALVRGSETREYSSPVTKKQYYKIAVTQAR
jgi:hypothetical protein